VATPETELEQLQPASLQGYLGNDSPQDLITLKNYFGALSEKAITYSDHHRCCTKLCVTGCQVEIEVIN
jgi:hypothetical protein